jgi:glycosyltransferase involved in cell wall biosynthesis
VVRLASIRQPAPSTLPRAQRRELLTEARNSVAAMKALLVMRHDAHERYGGDTALVESTARALRSIGVAADVVSTNAPDARGYDVAHVFNVTQPEVCGPQVDACLASGVPVALSTIWLDLVETVGRGQAYHERFSRVGDARRLEEWFGRMHDRTAESFLTRKQRLGLDRRKLLQAAILRRAHVLLPNSAHEARDCIVKLGVREIPFVVVPAGSTMPAVDAWATERHGIVQVGRVEMRKNQTMAALALRDIDTETTFVGAAHEAFPAAAIGRWAPRVRFAGAVSDENLQGIYSHALVHILPSWIETVGLASIEAAANGAQIVVSDRGPEVEYLGGDAEYADPSDPQSIRDAVTRAMRRPPRTPGDALDRRVRALSWEQSARATLRGYQIAIEAEARRR